MSGAQPVRRPLADWLSSLNRAVFAILLVTSLATHGANAASVADEPVAVPVELPTRDYARLLGDVLVQRVALGNRSLARLPVEGRIGRWLARDAATFVRDDENRQWMTLRYRIVNSPEQPVIAELPALTLAIDGAAAITIDAWPFALTPLAPLDDDGRLPPWRPDRLVDPDVAGTARRLRLAAVALGMALGCWALWWVVQRRGGRARRPFADALHTQRSLPRSARDTDPLAWRALHLALNHTAGGTHDADVAIARVPWLLPFADRLQAFTRSSDARFFATRTAAEPFDLHRLTRELARAERGT